MINKPARPHQKAASECGLWFDKLLGGLSDRQGYGYSMKTPNNLYEEDFYLWTQITAEQLKENQFTQVDVANLIEEIESMGRNEKRELKSRLIVLLMHLLKWHYQPTKRSESWRSTITEQRICIEGLLEDSPSLKPLLTEVFKDCYQKARIKASDETGIKLNFLPKESPFSLEETLESSYLDDER
ncbi:MAG: DUF29 domain-containing protein [Limnospira sp. PMC 1291.21]|uniref:DUF29 domain-containing protein n=3 Tax=Sirenicapillariaceae TaxID=2934961 RepID=A0A9P1KE02_9CYAN|nr:MULTISPECIES: DUF29 domain-containing protein [Limnospira]EKD11115.1 hypothetical protein SPLC1_S041120 [Arthrospira platensis C1]MDC0839182.1 DUF29 domain-containing protein [Limnoraphis robusta]MDY7054306.1 DUF29 domain-containing protein [Limnospira fusiformis LS22]QJB27789.1 DUF29 domain-containing protein [Limnospira fusiformis SAG 85.79]MDT9178806.1 DUF29 domain-containing protein [Limnospira sp. PMC 1238.20]